MAETPEGFARPLAQVIKEVSPPNSVLPAGGYGLTLDSKGKIADPNVLADFDGTAGLLNVSAAGAMTWTATAAGGYDGLHDTGALGAAAANIDITGLSQDYINLHVMFRLRGATAAVSTAIWFRLNNQSGGTAYLSAAGFDSKAVLGTMPAATTTGTDTAAYAVGQVVIPMYLTASAAHSISGTYAARVNTGGTAADFAGGAVSAVCGITTAFGAINQITVLAATGNLDVGSRVAVYGSA